MSNIRIFEDTRIRAKWNDDEDKWWFVVQDVLAFLSESKDPGKYWHDMKRRSEDEGVELSANCRKLKFQANNGKTYKYECADNEGLFRIIQSVPSPKAEPFKRWLAQLGRERIEEIEQPGKAVERARSYYAQKGFTSDWTNDRLAGIVSRNELTDYWQKSDIHDKEYGILTNQIYTSTFGYSASQYKEHKGLKKSESLRDNMGNVELVITRFAEVAAKEIAESKKAVGLDQNINAINDAGKIVSEAVKKIETETGKPIASSSNNKNRNNDKSTQSIANSEALGLPSGEPEGNDFNDVLSAIAKVPSPSKKSNGSNS